MESAFPMQRCWEILEQIVFCRVAVYEARDTKYESECLFTDFVSVHLLNSLRAYFQSVSDKQRASVFDIGDAIHNNFAGCMMRRKEHKS